MGWISHAGLGYGGYFAVIPLLLFALSLPTDERTVLTSETKRRNPAPFLPGQGFDRFSAAAAGSGATPRHGLDFSCRFGVRRILCYYSASLIRAFSTNSHKNSGPRIYGPGVRGKRTIHQKRNAETLPHSCRGRVSTASARQPGVSGHCPPRLQRGSLVSAGTARLAA